MKERVNEQSQKMNCQICQKYWQFLPYLANFAKVYYFLTCLVFSAGEFFQTLWRLFREKKSAKLLAKMPNFVEKLPFFTARKFAQFGNFDEIPHFCRIWQIYRINTAKFGKKCQIWQNMPNFSIISR